MGHEHRVSEFHWASISRPRRMTIGDLMIGIALAGLGSFTLVVTLRSQWTVRERAAFGIMALGLFALQAAQWGLANVGGRHVSPGMSTFLGIVSFVLALSTFVCLSILAAAFPEGAPLVVFALLVVVMYETTWA